MSPLIILVTSQGGACPYQAKGVLVIRGVEYPFYFRYRYDRAQMYIWESGHAYEFFDAAHPFAHFEQWDVTGIPHNGYMEDAEAIGFINRWATEFVQGLPHEQ